ncbi:MAG: LytR family transcriptional regulator [Solirubrobacterales bacterium]|nr:LytR family transcriptional regulator [Solirubrobacterales bacterium]
MLLGAVGVILVSGAATAVLALGEVSKIVEALNQNKAVKLSPKILAPTSAGSPETLLLVGDDRRPPPKGRPGGFVVPHSNEMLLVRIDPGKPTISMLSIPRELRVTIHPPGAAPVVNRINVAYTIGGIQLMTETIKRVLGIPVNHVFVVTFPKFRRAVNEMGCVFMTVDRRYHHVNEPGGEQYFEINLQPGYQRVCGRQALEFVASRHEDTSLTRDARDQRFLLEVKAQFGATLFESREKFERILGRAVETDLHGSGPVLDLLRLLVQAQGRPVRQVPFHVNLLPAFDTATPQQIHESVQSFLNGTAAIAKHKVSAAVHAARPRRHGAPRGLSLSATPGSALAAARSAAPNLPFALEYPRSRSSFAGAAPDTLRVYDLRDQRGRVHPIYVAVVNSGPLGQFYDVQGTSWADPPLLANPGQTVHLGSRTYGIFYAGEQIRTIAWREGGATYWIQNTLTNSIQPREMLALAEGTVPVVGTAGGPSPLGSSPQSFNVPPRQLASTSVVEELAAALGVATLVALALVALLVRSRRRDLMLLREQVAQAMSLEATQRPLLATAASITATERGPGTERVHTGELASAGERQPATRRGPTIYRSRKRLRRGALAGVAALLVGIGAAVALGLFRGSGSSQAVNRRVPVAVFNATGTPGAAQSLAIMLKADRIRLSQVGNINASLGKGVYVLYPAGALQQAKRIAQLIPNLSPTVAPIQPQVQNAVGRHDEIVVIFD